MCHERANAADMSDLRSIEREEVGTEVVASDLLRMRRLARVDVKQRTSLMHELPDLTGVPHDSRFPADRFHRHEDGLWPHHLREGIDIDAIVADRKRLDGHALISEKLHVLDDGRMRARQIEHVHIVSPCSIRPSERAKRAHMAEYRERITLGRAAREDDIIRLHLDEPRDSGPRVLEGALRLAPLLMRRGRIR